MIYVCTEHKILIESLRKYCSVEIVIRSNTHRNYVSIMNHNRIDKTIRSMGASNNDFN